MCKSANIYFFRSNQFWAHPFQFPYAPHVAFTVESWSQLNPESWNQLLCFSKDSNPHPHDKCVLQNTRFSWLSVFPKNHFNQVMTELHGWARHLTGIAEAQVYKWEPARAKTVMCKTNPIACMLPESLRKIQRWTGIML